MRRTDSLAYVQFGNGSWKCFDLAADPTWRTEVTDPAVVLPEAQAMLTWRSRHAERTWTGLHLGAAAARPLARAPGGRPGQLTAKGRGASSSTHAGRSDDGSVQKSARACFVQSSNAATVCPPVGTST